MSKIRTLEARQKPAAPLDTPTDLSDHAVRAIAKAVNGLLADAFALYLKTKNFHWHVSGPHFRDYHLLLDEQAEQIFATTDERGEALQVAFNHGRGKKGAGRVTLNPGETASFDVKIPPLMGGEEMIRFDAFVEDEED